MADGLPPRLDVRVLDDAESVAQALAGELLAVLPRRAAPRSVAVVLAGGRTPLRAYALVAERGGDVAWDRVHVLFGDERCVPPDDPASNHGAARDALLSRVPIPAANVHRIRGEAGPAAAATEYEVHARLVHAAMGFELALLGVGVDGHTASLFPDGPELDEETRWVAGTRSPAPPHDRVSMTLPAFAAARRLVLALTGAEKRLAFASLVAGDDRLPAVRASRLAPSVVLADRAAATR